MKKTLKEKKKNQSKKLERKGGRRKRTRERGGVGWGGGGGDGERKGYSFRELSSHVKVSFRSQFFIILPAVHFPYKEHYSLPINPQTTFVSDEALRTSAEGLEYYGNQFNSTVLVCCKPVMVPITRAVSYVNV